MKLTPEEIETMVQQAQTRFVERKEKRYLALKRRKTRLKRDQTKQAELDRLVTEARGK